MRLRRAWRRARPWAIALGLTVALTLLVTVGTVAALANARPSWWSQISPDEPSVLERAEQFETAVVSQLHRADRETDLEFVREHAGSWRSEPWRVRVSTSDANAWLNAKLPRWVESSDEGIDWPEQVGGVQLESVDGAVHIGVLVVRGNGSRVFSAELDPSVHEDGSLWTRASWVRLGRVPVPASWALGGAQERIGDLLDEELKDLPQTELIEAFDGTRPILVEPTIRLGDGRRVRLLGIEPRDGWLELTCRTEWR